MTHEENYVATACAGDDDALVSSMLQEALLNADMEALAAARGALYTAVGQINLTAIINGEDKLPPRAVLDARHVLTALTSFQVDKTSAHAQSAHLALIRLCVRQLFVDNVHRQQQRSATLDSILGTMTVWGRDILEIVDAYLPLHQRQDAAPELLTSSREQGGDEESANSHGNDLEFIWDSHFFESAMALLEDVSCVSTLQFSCNRCAFRLYGALQASRTLSGTTVIGSVVDVARYTESMSRRMECHEEGKSFLQGVDTAVDASNNAEHNIVDALQRHLARSYSYSGKSIMVPISMFMQAIFTLHSGADDYLYADGERGMGRRSDKQLAMWTARNDAIKSLTVWKGGLPVSNHGEPEEDHLLSVGILSLVASAMLQSTAESSLALSTSPQSLLFLLGPLIEQGLLARASVPLLYVLCVLDSIVASIPRYSISTEVEDMTATNTGGTPDSSTRADLYQTNRYKTMFGIVKHLISIAALTPISFYRRIGRFLTLELLSRLQETSRVRMLCSSMCLCPFGSVARTLVDAFSLEWREYETGRGGTTAAVFECDAPGALLQALHHFLRQVKLGNAKDFIDPLILLLNFFTVFIRADRRKPEAQQRLRPSSEWQRVADDLKTSVIPQCEALAKGDASEEGNNADSTGISLVAAPLSPLDAFSLESAVSMLMTTLHP